MNLYRYELLLEEENRTQSAELYETRLAAKFSAVAAFNGLLEDFDVQHTSSVDDFNWAVHGDGIVTGHLLGWTMTITIHEMEVVRENAPRRNPVQDGYSWERG